MPNPKDIDLQKLKKANQFAAEPVVVKAAKAAQPAEPVAAKAAQPAAAPAPAAPMPQVKTPGTAVAAPTAPPIGAVAPASATPLAAAKQAAAPPVAATQPAEMLQVKTPAKLAPSQGNELEASKAPEPKMLADSDPRAKMMAETDVQRRVADGRGTVGRPTFDRNAANVARPSDFVGFDTFGGLNADAMARMADAAAAETYRLRNAAAASLRTAEAEARSTGKPLEQTAAFAEYRAQKAKADEAGGTKMDDGQAYAGNLAPTGNPYEDALRAAYASSQRGREQANQGVLDQAGTDAAHWDKAGKAAATEAAGFDAKAKADAEAAAKAAAEAGKSAKEKQAAFNSYLGQVRSLGNESVQYDKLGANEEAIMRRAFEAGMPPEEAVRQLTSLMALRGK